MPRQPARLEAGRTAGDVFAGLGALVLLAALVGGVPYALLLFAGPPLPEELLNGNLLTTNVGTSTIVAVLVLVVWLAWLQLLLCVLVEVYAGIRRVGMPARIPLAGGTQALANRLVSAVLLLFTVSAIAIPVARMGAPPPTRPAVTTVAQVTMDRSDDTRSAVADDDRPSLGTRQVKKVYVVQPPHGRHHESLWEIAEKCLGDGRRYHEIYQLNQHTKQPDGSRLHIADLIRPGWVLDMPDDAVNVHVVPANQDKEHTLADHRGKPAELDGRTQDIGGARSGDVRGGDERDGNGSGDASVVLPPAALPSGTSSDKEQPGSGAAESSGEAPGGQATGRGPATDADQGQTAPAADLMEYLAGASLAAAGLLLALGRRRREQLWHRAFGRRIARPRGDAADAEVALRLGSDAPGSRMLDIGLRLLGKLLAQRGRTPPTIYAVHLSARGLDLWIHPPEADPPEPWTAHDGGQIWRLPAHEGRRIDEHTLADVPAPYPGLVSLGTNHAGRVLIDLEAAPGLINITGSHTTAALSALAVELATNRWSDRMRVTLVGFGTDLTLIAPQRVRSVGTLAEVLPELEAQAESAPGPGDVLTGRVGGRAADPAWPPHYLLSAIRPDADEARRLAMLARAGARTAAGYVVAGDLPYATWTWHVGEDGRMRADALGLDVAAQLLPRRHYDAVISLFRTAQHTGGDPLFGGDGLAEGDHWPPAVLDEPPAIEVRVLGPVEITPVNPLEEGRAALAAELIVYLATHPEGVHPVVLGGVLWPRGVQAAVRDNTIARVAEWLGRDSTGRPHLHIDGSGRLRLGPEVRTDWQLFKELVRRSQIDHERHAALLERALRLVRGPLLSGRPPGRYAWLAADDLEYDVSALVADAAHRLCEVLLAGGDAGGAVVAARAGLLLAADDEGLWRDLLRAVHATGDLARLRTVVDGLHRRAASHPYGGGMAPETEALIDDLFPTWRLHSRPSA